MQATAQAQPNIALVKYWGKRDVARNLPATGSISITLDSLWTKMSVAFDEDLTADELHVNGVVGAAMLPRVARCLDLVAGDGRPRASVQSECNFPIAAGLASSASAFAALVVAANEAAGLVGDRQRLARTAGAASGSAARSLFDGFVELSSGVEQIDVAKIAGPEDWPLEVVVAVTREDAKPVSSGEAMLRSAQTSPFYPSWLEQQAADLENARNAIVHRDFAALANVAEHNCLKMHSVMWASRPPIVYWNKATLACMEAIRHMQSEGLPVFFTIDAGPQLKAVCLPEAGERVAAELQDTAGVIAVMRSSLGAGARLLEPT